MFLLTLLALVIDERDVRVAEPTPPTDLPLTFVPPPTSLCSVPGLCKHKRISKH